MNRIEGIIPDGWGVSLEVNVDERAAVPKRALADPADAFGYQGGPDSAAAFEGAGFNQIDLRTDREFGEGRARIEGPSADGGDRIANGHAFQSSQPKKREWPNMGDRVAGGDTGQVVASEESTFCDSSAALPFDCFGND